MDAKLSRRDVIAVVEDDLWVRDALGLAIEAHGWTARLYPSGQGLLAALGTGGAPPDVLVLDLDLPDMGGTELQARVASLGYHIPVIVLTATTDSAQTNTAWSQGAVTVLYKPASYETLTQAVEKALHR